MHASPLFSQHFVARRFKCVLWLDLTTEKCALCRAFRPSEIQS